jgi:hypothetical protein
MKYIKTYETITKVNYSDLDKIIDNQKNSFYNELKSDFSKYLTPEIINYKKKETEIFLLKPDFGILIIVDFHNYPYRTIGEIYPIFKIRNVWIKRKAIFYIEKNIWKLQKEKMIPITINTLNQKYNDWQKRILNRDLKKYNL